MNLIEIKDINAPEMDVFARLTERELRTMNEPEEGIFLAESANVILRAIEDGYEPLSMLVEEGRLEVEAGPVLDAIEKYCGNYIKESLECQLEGPHRVRMLQTAQAAAVVLYVIVQHQSYFITITRTKSNNCVAR